MSTLSEEARAKAKDKAERLVAGDPHARVDASDYRPDGEMAANAQTGPRPISRRQFRRGGKVAGEASAPRADRKPRASGGRTLTADSLINRDVKTANDERVGTKHIGGMKRGGRALPAWAHRAARASGGRTHKLVGGALTPQQRMGMQQGMARTPPAGGPGGPMTRPVMRKEGGKVHADEAQDRKLIHEMGCQCGKCSGGRVARAEGGKLTTEGRKHIKAKNFAGPDRSYPIENASHARNALARVAQHGSPELQKEVRAKVHAKYPGIGKKNGGAINDGTRPTGGRLARKGGGRTKKGTNVNIIITQPPQRGAMPMPPPGMARPPGAPPGPPPGAPPVGMAQGMPPQGAPGMPPAQPLQPRASGGRAYPIDAGAGGGLGRLEKAERAARA